MFIRHYSVLVLLFLAPCTTMQEIEKTRTVDKGRESGETFFFIKPDGQKIAATKISRPATGNHIYHRITADGTQLDAPEEVMAFQDAKGYFKFMKTEKPNRWEKGEFLQRLRGGNMSLYFKGYYAGGREDYYYFDKGDGPLALLTYESFKAALSDKPEVLAEFERLYPKKKIMVNRQMEENSMNLPRLVEMYNQ